MPELLLNFKYIHSSPDDLKHTAGLQVWQERHEQEILERKQQGHNRCLFSLLRYAEVDDRYSHRGNKNTCHSLGQCVC